MSYSVETQSELLRQKALEAAKRHKTSWIELGQYLYSIYKDKLYKAWGFLSFETYCVKEVGMKQMTATKVLKSYAFLGQEEPRFVDPDLTRDEPPGTVPNVESVNLLRLAKDNEKLTPQDYAEVRESVLHKASEPKDVRAQVKRLLSEHEVKDPSEVRRERRNSAIRRVVTVIKNAKRELQNDNLLPDYLFKQMDELTFKLEDQIEA